MSPGFPLQSRRLVPSIDPEELFPIGKPGVTGFDGELVWNRPGELRLQGVSLADGMRVRFVGRRGRHVTTAESRTEQARERPPAAEGFTPLTEVVVPVPEAVTTYPVFRVVIDLAGPSSHATSAPSAVIPQEPFEVPFGLGRLALVAVRDRRSGELYIVEAGPSGEPLTRPGGRTRRARATRPGAGGDAGSDGQSGRGQSRDGHDHDLPRRA